MISSLQYKNIQNSINQIFVSQNFIYDQMQDILDIYNQIENPSVVVSNIVAQDQNNLASVYTFIQDGSGYSEIQFTVKILQQHIIRNGLTVDKFLTDNLITVSQNFAKVSSNVGYPISIQNIT